MRRLRTDAQPRRAPGRDPPSPTDHNAWVRERQRAAAEVAAMLRGDRVVVFVRTGLLAEGVYVGLHPTRHYGLWHTVIVAGGVRRIADGLVVPWRPHIAVCRDRAVLSGCYQPK